jgi:ribose/xylose/arabinose/galactoside ABC-type transport system permease subunit
MTANIALVNKIKKMDWKSPVFSALIAMIVISIVFAVMNPKFLLRQNIVTIFLNASVIGIFASGMTMVIVSGNIDLSTTGTAAIAAMLFGMLYEKGVPLYLCCFAGLGGAGLCGLINGLLVAKVKLNSLIVTIANMLAFRSVAYAFTNVRTITLTDQNFFKLGRMFISGIPVSVIYMFIFFIVMGYILEHTAFGRRIYAIGGNLQASFYNGINIEITQIQLFVLMGCISGFGGLVTTAQSSAAAPIVLTNREFDFISPCIIGGIAMSGGKGKIVGTFVGCIFLAIVANGMVLIGLQSYWQNLVKGLILIFAMTVDAIRNRQDLT